MDQHQHRIGIMGGTFDPIHIGHLVTAETVRLAFALDKVIFVPAGLPPNKQNALITPIRHRYIMTVMATYSNPNFFVSSIEMDRPGPSYTIDTLKEFCTLYGNATKFFFITGSDAVTDLPTWKDINNLLNICEFVVAARPGCSITVDKAINYFDEQQRQRIHRFATKELEISSTDIRERVKKGFSIKYIVPESVENYILKQGLYSNSK